MHLHFLPLSPSFPLSASPSSTIFAPFSPFCISTAPQIKSAPGFPIEVAVFTLVVST